MRSIEKDYRGKVMGDGEETQDRKFGKKLQSSRLILAQKQKCRPMERDRKLRGKPMDLCAPYLTKEARLYNGEVTASSINSTGELHVKKAWIL